ncbi:RING-H2 finger protein ATL1 [Hibiscus syriacus]|uniref:RING-type E3 ubiquitin transferase n=1 Tax=Hibiscus syriacus TaxID=106335 RepID=A0A6A3BM22_HIBSY|nr:RING-H2 finger protein ATL16-like [Hibiscus syriacus]KAE8717653.1 RING-H2 finger protein ATL1 [Hibiscus syriacus]
MDLVSKTRFSQALSPPTSPVNSISASHPHSYDSSFPIIAVAVLGILATAFLLLSYYIFVIKCCLNWRRIDLLRQFSLSRRRHDDPLMAYSPEEIERQHRGLDESVIRRIPIFRFDKESREGSLCECAVCLNKFEVDEKLRMIPNCSHVFHIDCIDVWLQNNANCPLCRTSISSDDGRFRADPVVAPSSTPQDPIPYTETIINGDEDFVVIEIGNNNPSRSTHQTLLGAQERLNSENSTAELSIRSISPPPWKSDQRLLTKKARKFHKGTSMGDECIDIRDKDEQFAIQPIRRSISMDSSADRQLFLAVQEAIRSSRDQQLATAVSPVEGCSSSRVKRYFFSFGHSRGSKNALSPVYLEP